MIFAQEKRIEKHLDLLATFTKTAGAGVTRLSYSKEDLQARQYIKGEMEAYGLVVREDPYGNIIGRLEGQRKDAPVVMVGSHFDSVPNGGAYDGTAGVVVGLEIAALFQEHDLQAENPLEVIALIEEEGSRFGGALMGSRAMLGQLPYKDFSSLTDDSGMTTIEAMKEAGIWKRDEPMIYPYPLKAFLELHIEQGPILEDEGKSIGIVSGIVGLRQLELTVQGQAGHAGTTPMNRRADALVAASTLISKFPSIAKTIDEEMVITSGKLQVYPNGANVIPDKVVFTVDIRSTNEQHITTALEKIEAYAEEAAECEISIECLMAIEPKAMDSKIIQLFEEQTKSLQLAYRHMPSGAGHDAMVFSDVTAAGMLFVPSREGLSHCPEEYTATADFVKGTNVLVKTIMTLTGAKKK